MTKNPVIPEAIRKEVRKDILELDEKIKKFRNNEIPEDKFKHFRLTRGVYGQRQLGVQMVRIKIPHGKLRTSQLLRIADVSEKYATGNLHLTTRQDIQIHFVKLEDSPVLWSELEQENITLREACGNTVRNVTASPIAGIDPDEPFDVTPYAESFTRYFLRNPVCQDMGRKFKVAFSSSSKDSAFTYIHDLGFIPVVRTIDNKEIRGFKVLIGGGLGAQAIMAQVIHEFIPEDEYIPFAESVIRVFDKYGERANRSKARLKFLIQKIGLPEFINLMKEEQLPLQHKKLKIDLSGFSGEQLPEYNLPPNERISEPLKFESWLKTNVFEQKQAGFFGIYIKVQTGDINHADARKLAEAVGKYAANDIRITMNQGLLLRFVKKQAFVPLFNSLNIIGLAEPGFNSTHDITTCPGTDTCNLGVTNSMEIARVLEQVLKEEYDDLIYDHDIHIKISGCMNSCGQHMAAQIGLHGSSIKKGELVAPAMQVVLGGGVDPDGKGYIADKIVKLPTKRIPDALRILLNNFHENALPGEYFNSYYRRSGKMYFYHLLKPLSEAVFTGSDYVDWGHEQIYIQEIGVGECAGIMLDVVTTIIDEASEKLEMAREGLELGIFANSIYNSYNTLVIGAKAILLSRDIQCNTQAGIIKDFQENLVKTKLFHFEENFEEFVYQINKQDPSDYFAGKYYTDASQFLKNIKHFREEQLIAERNQENKTVVSNYYKA